MKTTLPLILLLACGSVAAEIVEEPVDFEYNGARHRVTSITTTVILPNVFVSWWFIEWWGLNEYACERTRQMATDGYVAFAIPPYMRLPCHAPLRNHPHARSILTRAILSDPSVLNAPLMAFYAEATQPHTTHAGVSRTTKAVPFATHGTFLPGSAKARPVAH